MNKIFNLNWIVVISLLLVLVGCSSKKESFVEQSLDTSIGDATDGYGEEESQKEDSLLGVYVCGCVLRPGVYFLSSENRVCDAIECAGGITEDASVNYWNLAQKIEDGMKIYIPTTEEALSMEPQEGTMNTSKSEGKININTADKDELMKLPGIGSTRADRIISYRTEHGNFSDIKDLMNVSGIKGTIYQEIEDYITVF